MFVGEGTVYRAGEEESSSPRGKRCLAVSHDIWACLIIKRGPQDEPEWWGWGDPYIEYIWKGKKRNVTNTPSPSPQRKK